MTSPVKLRPHFGWESDDDIVILSTPETRTSEGARKAWDKRGRGNRTIDAATEKKILDDFDAFGYRHDGTETMKAYGSDGSPGATITDHDSGAVQIDSRRAQQVRFKAIVHNHPNSSSFSVGDLGVSLGADAPMVAALGRDGSTFVLHRPAKGWPHPEGYSMLDEYSLNMKAQRLTAQGLEHLRRGPLSDEDKAFLSSDLAVSHMAKRFGLLYERNLTPHRQALVKRYGDLYD